MHILKIFHHLGSSNVVSYNIIDRYIYIIVCINNTEVVMIRFSRRRFIFIYRKRKMDLCVHAEAASSNSTVLSEEDKHYEILPQGVFLIVFTRVALLAFLLDSVN